MNEASLQSNPDQVGLSARILVGALITGLLCFTGIVLMTSQGKPAQVGILSYLGVAIFVVNVIVSLVLSKSTASRLIRQIAVMNPSDWRPELAHVYKAKLILADAPLEGAGFFNGVVYLIDAHWMNLAILFAILALMAITFPSQSQFEAWAEQVQRDHS